MNIKQWITLLVCTFFLIGFGTPAFSADMGNKMTGHAFYGKMQIPYDDSDIEDDKFEITIFGVDGQKPLGGETMKYGWETGAVFSIDSDTQSLAASGGSGGGTVLVAVDVKSIMIDYFLGGYLAVEPNKHFRLFVGAGPLAIWAKRETEPEDSAPDYIQSSSDSELGAGVYGRIGLDIFLTEQFGFTAGARITETTLTFKDDTGKTDLQGYQCYFGIAFRF